MKDDDKDPLPRHPDAPLVPIKVRRMQPAPMPVPDREPVWPSRGDHWEPTVPIAPAAVPAPAPTGRPAPPPPRAAQRRQRWLVIAIAAATAIIVATGGALWLYPGDADDDPTTTVQWQVVTSGEQLEILPTDTRFVECRNLDDDDLSCLRHLPRLEGLRLVARRYATGNPPLRLLTDDSLPRLQLFKRLRIVELDGQTELTGANLGAVAELPRLEHLRLSGFDLDDSAIGMLANTKLRSLDLSFNHGFRTDGMLSVGRIGTLRKLRLCGCSQLNVAMLSPLQQLRQLEDLDLGNLGPTWRPLPANAPAAATARRQEQRRQAHNDEAGLTADLIDCLPPQLRRLSIAGSPLDDDFVRILALRVRRLQQLDLSDDQQITDVAVSQALSLPLLERLNLCRTKGISSLTFDLLQRSSRLKSVALDEQPWLAPGQVGALLLRGLEVSCNSSDGEFVEAVELVRNRLRETGNAAACSVVGDAAEIAALPEGTLAVEGHDLDGEAVSALARLHKLESLSLRYGVQAKAQADEPMAASTDDSNLRSIADEDLERLRELRQLRSLELAGAVRIDGSGLKLLAQLPRLQELRLFCIDTTDEGLADLPALQSLRTLAIEWNQGLGERGLEAVAHCRQLRSLRLTGMPQLHGNWLQSLANLTLLEHLVLRRLDAATWRDDGQRSRDVVTLEKKHRAALEQARSPGAGLTDAALTALPSLPRLRSLDLSGGRLTNRGVTALQDLPQLERLTLSDNPELSAAAVEVLPRRLAGLAMANCRGVTDAVGEAALRHLPNLQFIDLSGNPQLTIACLRAVLTLPSLCDLRLRNCSGLTAEAVNMLLDADQLKVLDVGGCAGWTADKLVQMRTRVPLVLKKS